ncbi:hypothetical protein PC118_g16601 [Phytophthora cactorum]|uniref:MULE transposase domain-containing protein n=2 Tax=Phytophthora cactorum TaxID=29920 RepID=A0A8T1FI77_9STRA|nr:hypothetical protein PC118_g16601 [Phytophthora cactorum]
MLICVLKFATDGVQSVRFAWFQPKGGRINLLAQLVQRHDGSWSMMKRELYCHNHPLTEDIYRSYPAKAGTPSVYNYIRENSKHRVTMDDVRNLIARLKNRGVELSGDNAVAEMILDFNHELPRNVSSVHRSVPFRRCCKWIVHTRLISTPTNS